MAVVRALVRRVCGWKDRVELDLNELSVAGLKGLLAQALGRENALRKVNVKRFVKCPRSQKNTTVRDRGKHGQRTVVVELPVNWRGPQGHNTEAPNPSPVLDPEKVYLFPAFSLTWFTTYERINNGERVLSETLSSCGQKTTGATEFDFLKFKSRQSLPGVTGVKPLGHRPDGAAIGYARP